MYCLDDEYGLIPITRKSPPLCLWLKETYPSVRPGRMRHGLQHNTHAGGDHQADQLLTHGDLCWLRAAQCQWDI